MATSETTRERATPRKVERRRALVYETDALVGERLRQMLHAEGYVSAWVDQAQLFDELRSLGSFALYVIGARRSEELRAFSVLEVLDPLLLLVPLDAGDPINPYRLLHPGAALIDRALRDVDAIRRALTPSPEASRSESFSRLGTDAIARAFEHFGLSERQLEVLERALRGDTSAQIASRLFISELTVRNHLHAIYERVGVSGRRELLGRFVQGLMEGNA